MFRNNTKQTDTLERFRIKAHLRSYLKDPVEINDGLMKQAVARLKTLPYQQSDPSGKVALEVLYAAYSQGYIESDELTEQGLKTVKLYQPLKSPDRTKAKRLTQYCTA